MSSGFGAIEDTPTALTRKNFNAAIKFTAELSEEKILDLYERKSKPEAATVNA